MTAIRSGMSLRTSVVTPTAVAVKTEATEASQPTNYFAIYGSSVFVMTLLFLLGVGIPAAMAYGNATGWALGAFCAFWGGPGFGVMAGGARVSALEEKHAGHEAG